MTETFRLALYQGPSPAGDEGRAFAAAEQVMATAAAAGADMAVFPEVFLPGYNVGQMVAQPLDGPWVTRLSELARRHGVAAVMGLAERDGERIFNTAVAIGPDGALIARFRKIQLWEARENALYGRGDALVTFDYRGRTIGVLICYDIEFPEHVRTLVRKGADLIVVPTANPEPYHNVNQYAVPARAMENAITVAYCNYCGPEGDLVYCGRSLIAGPEGDALASAGTGTALLIADLPAPGAPLDRPTEHLKDLRSLP